MVSQVSLVNRGMPSLKRYRLAYSRCIRVISALFFIFLISLIFVPSSTAALDPPSIEWGTTYEGLQVNSVIQTSDGGYALSGAALTPGGATLIKTDSSGNVQWQKAFGNVVSLAQTPDLGFVLFCENGDVIKTDAEGNRLSTFSLGANKGVRQGIITEDETYIVVGNAIREGQETYVWLRKFDPQGTILWDLNFTGGFQVSAIVNTIDRGCALAGNWKNNFWLARLDSNGNQQWSQNYVYGDPLDEHIVYSLARTKDGGFILAGTGMWQSSGGMIPWLIKINSQGYEQWNLPYGQYPGDSFSAIVQTADQGYFAHYACICIHNACRFLRQRTLAGTAWHLANSITIRIPTIMDNIHERRGIRDGRFNSSRGIYDQIFSRDKNSGANCWDLKSTKQNI